MQFFTADIGDINWRMHLEYISDGEVTLNRENATRFGCEVSVYIFSSNSRSGCICGKIYSVLLITSLRFQLLSQWGRDDVDAIL